jgi:hypothetical protein
VHFLKIKEHENAVLACSSTPVPQVFFSHKALPALALVYLSRPKAPEQAHTLWLTYW